MERLKWDARQSKKESWPVQKTKTQHKTKRTKQVLQYIVAVKCDHVSLCIGLIGKIRFELCEMGVSKS